MSHLRTHVRSAQIPHKYNMPPVNWTWKLWLNEELIRIEYIDNLNQMKTPDACHTYYSGKDKALTDEPCIWKQPARKELTPDEE